MPAVTATGPWMQRDASGEVVMMLPSTSAERGSPEHARQFLALQTHIPPSSPSKSPTAPRHAHP